MKEQTLLEPEENRILIDAKYPLLLTRSMAESMTGLEGQYLDMLRKKGDIKVYKTFGGHFRFHRDSLINHINNNLVNGI